jgi:competence protein ComFB
VALYNVTEALVRMMLEDAYLHKGRLACECEQCIDDIMAIALNRLPSRYVSTDEGMMYAKAQYFDPQLQSDVIRELALASSIDSQKPRHKQSSGLTGPEGQSGA